MKYCIMEWLEIIQGLAWYYYYVKVMFAHSYNEDSHERRNVNNML